MEIITNNYEWIFSGIGVLIIGYFITPLMSKNNKSRVSPVTSTVNITNNVNSTSLNQKHLSSTKIDERSKNLTRILFIDDNHTEYKMVSILKKSGWINTKSVKDVTDLDDPKVLESDIIFVDINGVGTTLFQDQGLGLASALKKKYSNKKIVIYSSETNGDRFHKALREVDDCLYKDAEPYQFINLIESFQNKNK